MSKKHTFEYVEQCFEDNGCKLLETEYKNSHTLMRYECDCGNISKITFGNFRQGRRCRKCANKKLRKDRQFSFKYVYNYFIDEGCVLLETEYANNYTKMRYECNCGDINKISFSDFQQGRRCWKCGLKKRSEKRRHTLEYVKQCFKDEGCVLLEDEYIGSRYKMKYICSCGNISKINFTNFSQDKRCNKCGVKKASEKQKHTLKYVKQCFLDEGCVLLETEYINTHTLMKYKCNCGNISKIKFSHFKDGHRCKKCGSIKGGENHPNYNPNLTDEEREANKSRLSDCLYKKWRIGVYKRDLFICQKCKKRKNSDGKRKKLNGHHIESWGSCPKLRLDEKNGITMCKCCHKEFHHIYGYGSNTKQQLEEFFNIDSLK